MARFLRRWFYTLSRSFARATCTEMQYEHKQAANSLTSITLADLIRNRRGHWPRRALDFIIIASRAVVHADLGIPFPSENAFYRSNQSNSTRHERSRNLFSIYFRSLSFLKAAAIFVFFFKQSNI